jgi:hypothetical protein
MRAALLLVSFITGVTTLTAGDITPGVAPPNSNPVGTSYARWGAAWWQWVFSLHALSPLNPLLATGNVDCSYGQVGQVWFLTGSNVSGTVTRSCKVPTGTRLFFPVLNSWADNVAVFPPVSLDTLIAEAAAFSNANDLHASIDGAPVKDLFGYRAPYAPFSYTVPATDNMLQYFGANVPGSDWPTTFIFPAASDGYYLMLEPLPSGPHTINFGGTSTTGFQIDVTYSITVVPKGQF